MTTYEFGPNFPGAAEGVALLKNQISYFKAALQDLILVNPALIYLGMVGRSGPPHLRLTQSETDINPYFPFFGKEHREETSHFVIIPWERTTVVCPYIHNHISSPFTIDAIVSIHPRQHTAEPEIDEHSHKDRVTEFTNALRRKPSLVNLANARS